MTLKLRQGDPTRIQKVKVERSFRGTRREFAETGQGQISTMRQKVIALFRRMYAGLGKKTFEHKDTQGSQVPLVEEYNKGLLRIDDDLNALFQETGSVRELQQAVFNYNQVLTEDLARRSNEGASKVIDLRLLAGQLQDELLVGGDDFNSLSRVDTQTSRDHPLAEIVTDQGVVTLQRVSSEQVFGSDTQVSVIPLSSVTRHPKPRNLQRFYEGRFYAYMGQARPEGGVFNLEERVAETTVTQGVSHTLLTVIDGETIANEWFLGKYDPETQQYGDSEGYENSFKDLRLEGGQAGAGTPANQVRAGQPVRPEDIQVIDLGASEEDRERARQAIVDGNPDTTWECEYVIRVGENDSEGRIFPASPDDIVVGEETDPDPATQEYRFRDQAAFAAFLRKQSVDIFDLDVEVVLRLPLGQQRHANFISLDPLNFGETAWLEVLDISTAETEESPFEPIEGFDQGLFANTLTDEANEELQEGAFKATLAPTKFAYRGQGIWTFPTRKINGIRIQLRQKKPIPAPYQRMHIQMRRTVTRSVGTWSVIRDQTKVVKLSYLQTVQAMDDLNFRNEIAGVTTGGSSSGSQTKSSSAKWYYYAFFGLFGGGPKSSSVSTSHNDSGWQVVRNWLSTYWDLMRYSIGIKDIGVFGYIFAPKSEIVSVPFISPKSLLKVQVKVDDFIPAALGVESRWIEYSISVDNGQSWLSINPLDRPTEYDDEGAIIPYTYTFNAEVEGPQGDTNRVVNTTEPVRQVRFRAVLSTNSAIEDGERLTPVLKSYRVLMTPRGGLSDAGI